jgi:hypothetical protein
VSLKERIQEVFGIPSDQQEFPRLYTQNKSLYFPSETLGAYGIKSGDTIELSSVFDPMKVFVCDYTGDVITLSVSRMDSIKSVKSRIEVEDEIPIALLFHDKELDDDKTLMNYDVTPYSRLTVLPIFMGGGVGPFSTPPPLKFVDIMSDKIETLVVTATAPDWRVFDKGLTMEGLSSLFFAFFVHFFIILMQGLCSNKKCVAFNQKVLSREGYTIYNLRKNKSKCPICHTDFAPIRPMYYKCVVVYHGIRADGARSLLLGVVLHFFYLGYRLPPASLTLCSHTRQSRGHASTSTSSLQSVSWMIY